MVQVNAENAGEAAKAVRNGDLPGPAKSLAEAMARIYADGGRYVQKTGQMQGVARYSYAKEGDFIAAIRPLMEAHGVTIRPIRYELLANESFERKTGSQAYRVVVLATFEFLHASGDKATAQAIGEGQDSGDKAFNKAMTGAMKYVLRQTFCVETGDDPDDTPSHEQERATTAPKDAATVAKLTQQFAMCKTETEWAKACDAVKAASATLSPAGLDHVRRAAKDTHERIKAGSA